MTDKLTFDFDAVTPRMLIDFKDRAGVSLYALLSDDGTMNLAAMSEEATAGMVWLALRMSGRPDATWDDALDTPFSSLSFAEGGEPDPTNASSAT